MVALESYVSVLVHMQFHLIFLRLGSKTTCRGHTVKVDKLKALNDTQNIWAFLKGTDINQYPIYQKRLQCKCKIDNKNLSCVGGGFSGCYNT